MNASPVDLAGESWLTTARRPQIVARAIRVAAVVGTVLVAVHYADRILAGSLAPFDWLRMGVTYLVPYCVSTFTAVQMSRRER